MRVIHSVRPALIAGAILAVLSLASSSAKAQVSIKLDNPFQTVAAPGSGTTILNFTGTVSIDSGFTYDQASLDVAFNSTSTGAVNTTFSSLNLSAANNGGSVSGLLFTAAVPSSTVADFYGYEFFSLNPSIYQVTVVDSAGAPTSNSADFSITVTASAVPEPSAIVMLSSVGLSGVGLLIRRRKSR